MYLTSFHCSILVLNFDSSYGNRKYIFNGVQVKQRGVQKKPGAAHSLRKHRQLDQKKTLRDQTRYRKPCPTPGKNVLRIHGPFCPLSNPHGGEQATPIGVPKGRVYQTQQTEPHCCSRKNSRRKVQGNRRETGQFQLAGLQTQPQNLRLEGEDRSQREGDLRPCHEQRKRLY